MKVAPFALCIGLCLASAAPRAYAEDVVGEWDLGSAEIDGDTVVVDESAGVAGELFNSHATGIHVEAKEGNPGKSALFFEGNPPGSLVSKKSNKWEEGQDFQIDVEVNPAGTTGGYVVRLFCNFAMEYYPPNNNIALIVWFTDGKGESVGTNIGAGEWSTVSARLLKGEISITVNGHTETKALPEGAVLAAANAPLWVACAKTNAETSFAGGIGKLRVLSLP